MARTTPHPSYNDADNTYTLKRTQEWKVEVGDKRTTNKFIPHLRVSRWLDEAWYGLNIPNGWFGGGDALQIDGEKIVWSRGIYSARFYDLPSEPGDEGGFEFEFELASQPPTNNVDIPIERGNTEWIYQPLDPAEYGQADVPDRVLGSYAIYATGGRKHNQYKTGKVGHLYRPFATDALGRTTWCAYNTDAEATGVLNISIPQAFLDAATADGAYPIVIDPTVGHTSLGATGYYATSGSTYDHTTLRSDQVTTGAATITAGYVATYITTSSVTFQTKVTCYDKGANVGQDDLITTSSAYTTTGPVAGSPASATWKTHTMSGTLSAATEYQAGVIRDPDDGSQHYRIAGDYNNNAQAGLSESTFTPPSTLTGYSTTATLADRRLSVYFEYSAGGTSASASIGGRVAGHSTATGSIGGRVAGSASASGSIGGRVAGEASTSGSFGGRVAGEASTSASVGGRVAGSASAAGSIGGRVAGGSSASASIGGRVAGEAQASASIGGRVAASAGATGSISGRVSGHGVATGSIGGRIASHSAATGSFGGRIAGSAGATGSIGGRVEGSTPPGLASASIGARVAGHASAASSIGGRAAGHVDTSASIGGRVAGEASGAAAVGGRVHGSASASASIGGRVEGISAGASASASIGGRVDATGGIFSEGGWISGYTYLPGGHSTAGEVLELRPASMGTYSMLTVTGAATGDAALRDDSDSSYVRITSATLSGTDTYVLGSFTAPDALPSLVRVILRIGAIGDYIQNIRVAMYYGGDLYVSPETYPDWTAITNVDFEWAQSPFTDAAWTWSEIQTMEVGVQINRAGSPPIYLPSPSVYELTAEIEYAKQGLRPAHPNASRRGKARGLWAN